MNTRLELCPTSLPGFMKVSASVGEMDVRLSGWNGEMPVLQLEEAGIVIELEFFDVRGLERLALRLSELVRKVGPLEPPEPLIEVASEEKRRSGQKGRGTAGPARKAELPTRASGRQSRRPNGQRQSR